MLVFIIKDLGQICAKPEFFGGESDQMIGDEIGGKKRLKIISQVNLPKINKSLSSDSIAYFFSRKICIFFNFEICS